MTGFENTGSTPAVPAVVLASASPYRARMLRHAGVACVIDPATIDETAVKEAMRAEEDSADDTAILLASLKAERVSRRHGGALVIGADQLLVCDGEWFDKPIGRAGAEEQLRRLRGRRHTLLSAAVVVRDGERLWHHLGRAHVGMRDFSDAVLDAYLDAMGADVETTVGGYQIEGRGVQLLSAITGDFFDIMGLPLLPLLDVLRVHGVLPT